MIIWTTTPTAITAPMSIANAMTGPKGPPSDARYTTPWTNFVVISVMAFDENANAETTNAASCSIIVSSALKTIVWPAELYNNLDYIHEQISNGEKIGTYNLNKSQLARNDKKIYITRTGFSILQKALNLPFKSIDEFDNNTMSANFKTSITTFRFDKEKSPLTYLVISPIESNDTPEIRKLKNEITKLEEVEKELKVQNIENENIEKNY